MDGGLSPEQSGWLQQQFDRIAEEVVIPTGVIPKGMITEKEARRRERRAYELGYEDNEYGGYRREELYPEKEK